MRAELFFSSLREVNAISHREALGQGKTRLGKVGVIFILPRTKIWRRWKG